MSVGVAQIRSGEDADALCIRVDDALYAAKRSGKNQVKAG
jgi:PleD family two-component response regulator